MVYIRVKKISNKDYAYLVENVKTSKGPRQKVKQYLGRVHSFNTVKEVNVNNSNVLLKLVLSQLQSFGFKEKDKEYCYKSFVFSVDNFSLVRKTKSKTIKDAVISSNDGYLCSYTLQRIANFKKSKDFQKDGYQLARYFLAAGLEIDRGEFVEFYTGLKK
jgi:hypothetical protein